MVSLIHLGVKTSTQNIEVIFKTAHKKDVTIGKGLTQPLYLPPYSLVQDFGTGPTLYDDILGQSLS